MAAAAAEETGTRASTKRWERIRDAIVRDVAVLDDPGGSLGTPKSLCAKYGCCFRTLRRALDGLERAGLVDQYRRGIRGATIGSSPGTAILLAMPADNEGKPALYTPRSAEILRAFETECARRSMRLEHRCYDRLGGTWQAGYSGGESRGSAFLGSVLWIQGRVEQPERILSLLRGAGGRQVVLDESGSVNAHALRTPVMPAGGTPLCGATMGAYLLSLGHRRICYISPTHRAQWSRNRLDGLLGACAAAGQRDGVLVCAHDSYTESYEFLPERERAGRNVYRLLDPAHAPGNDPTTAAVMTSLRTAVTGHVIRAAFGAMVTPLFERALALDTTAWVCANDDVALAALTFLRERNVRVPGTVSVVGFDDTLAASSQGISSHNFATLATVRLTLDCILSPARRGAAAAALPETRGMVTPRASSGAPTPPPPTPASPSPPTAPS
jgi:hypothetical protein